MRPRFASLFALGCAFTGLVSCISLRSHAPSWAGNLSGVPLDVLSPMAERFWRSAADGDSTTIRRMSVTERPIDFVRYRDAEYPGYFHTYRDKLSITSGTFLDDERHDVVLNGRVPSHTSSETGDDIVEFRFVFGADGWRLTDVFRPI